MHQSRTLRTLKKQKYTPVKLKAQTACRWWMVMYSSLFSTAFHLLQFIIVCASIKTFGFVLSVWSPSITDACTRSIWHLGSHPETSNSQILRPLSFIPEGNSRQWCNAAISGEDRREKSPCCKDAKGLYSRTLTNIGLLDLFASALFTGPSFEENVDKSSWILAQQKLLHRCLSQAFGQTSALVESCQTEFLSSSDSQNLTGVT